MIKKINLLFLFTGTLVMLFVMAYTGKPLKTAATPIGILHLEFAFNKTQARAVLNAWDTTSTGGIYLLGQAKKNTWLDFIFLYFYSSLLFYCCKTISEINTGFTRRLGKWLAVAALIAGLCDILENTGMLLVLNNYLYNFICLGTVIFSSLKWTLIIPAFCYILVLGPAYLSHRNKSAHRGIN